MHISKICSTFAVAKVLMVNTVRTWNGSRSEYATVFFMFYNIFLAQKYEKMQKNAKK